MSLRSFLFCGLITLSLLIHVSYVAIASDYENFGKVKATHQEIYKQLSKYIYDDDPFTLSPDGTYAASASWDTKAVYVWNVKMVKCAELHLQGTTNELVSQNVMDMAISKDNTKLVVGTDQGFIHKWDLQTGILENKIQVHKSICAVAINENGDFAAAQNNGVIICKPVGKEIYKQIILGNPVQIKLDESMGLSVSFDRKTFYPSNSSYLDTLLNRKDVLTKS